MGSAEESLVGAAQLQKSRDWYAFATGPDACQPDAQVLGS